MQQQGLQQQRSSSSSSGGSLGKFGGADAAAAADAVHRGQLLSQGQLSKLVRHQLGYSLDVRRSGIAHQDAGVSTRLVCR